jgi:hypothetical protein
MARSQAVFASDHDLNLHNCIKTSAEGVHSCERSGWVFSSAHVPMIDSKALDMLQEVVAEGVGEQYQLHLPAIVFNNDVMRVQMGDAFRLELRAEDALRLWASQHLPNNERDSAPVIQVPYAKEWIEKSLFAQNRNNMEHRDAEAASSSSSSSSGSFPGAEDDSLSSTSASNSVFTRVVENTNVDLKPWDWTFSTEYCGTVAHGAGDSVPLSVMGLRQRTDANLRFRRTSRSGVDYTLLRNRTDPILFYDEGVLYTDDLEDCGEAQVDAKVRVMPSCWFLLLRMFVRVDHVTIRLVESRYFHKFGDSTVALDLTVKACSLTPPAAEESPVAAVAAPARAAASGPPVHDIPLELQRDANRVSQLLPALTQEHYAFDLADLDQV